MLSDASIQALIKKVGLTPEEITTALASRNKQEEYIASLRGQELQQAGDGSVAEQIAKNDREEAARQNVAQEKLQAKQMARAE